ncbi:MAG: flippase [Patescibacteria group bacterium]|nr:flippase [Patescibacteria group bacterium]
MSLARAVASNTAIQISGKVIGTILGILTVAVMTRHLGLTAYGEFTTATTFLQFFGILVDFGLTLTLIRLLAEPGADEQRVVSNVFTLRLASAAAFYGLAVAVGWLFPYSMQIKLGITLASFSYFGMTLSQTLVGVFQKKLAVARATIAEVAGRLVLFLGVVAVAKLGGGLLPIISLLIAGNAAQLTLNWIFVRRLVPVRLVYDRAYWLHVLRESWPVGVTVALNLVYLKSDVIILSLTRSQAEVGLYGAAYKVLDVITVVPSVFMGIVMPVLAAAWLAGDRAAFDRRLGRAFDFMIMLAVPLLVGTVPVATDLMTLVAGRDFAAAGPSLVILMGAGAAVFMSALFGYTVLAVGLQRRMIWGFATDAVLSLALYVWLIPRFGIMGAAAVTLFSEAFIAVVNVWVLRKHAHVRVSLRLAVKTLPAAALMYVCLIAVPSWPVLLRIALGAAVYFAALAAMRGVTREMIFSFLPERRPTPPAA